MCIIYGDDLSEYAGEETKTVKLYYLLQMWLQVEVVTERGSGDRAYS